MDVKNLSELSAIIHTIDPEKLPELIEPIRNCYKQLENDLPTLSNILFAMASNIMNINQVKPSTLKYYEQIIDDIILCSISHYYLVGSLALKYIFNYGAEFYKVADVDEAMKYPIGRTRPLQNYSPAVGQQCDVVKPYITSINQCGWVRCKVLEIDGKKYTLNYTNDQNPVITRQSPFFDKLGQRTQDYQWRMNLDIGHPIEAQLNQVWFKSTVAETSLQNDCKKVRVTFRRFTENGDRQEKGIRYFGLNQQEDRWLNVLSPKIQKPNSMVNKKLCYYSHNATDEGLLDDNYDIVFLKEYNEQPFHAIMRTLLTKSLSYIKFVDTFIKNEGFQRYFECLKLPNHSLDDICMVQGSLIGIIPFIPKMDIHRYLPELYQQTYQFFLDHSNSLNNIRIQMAYCCINITGKRLFSLTEVHQNLNNIRKSLIRVFLKMNMQKQMLALRYFYDLINPKIPYTDKQRDQFDRYIIEEKLFQQFFNNQIHEQILNRAHNILKYMIERRVIEYREIQYLWLMVPQSDQRGRQIIERLLVQTVPVLPIEYVEKLLQKILGLKQTELTLDNINLLRSLKNREITPDYQLRILTYLWQIITIKSVNIKTNIEEEIEKVFKAFVGAIKQPQLRKNVLQSMLNRLTETNKVSNEIDLLKDFIDSYPEKVQQGISVDAPLTIFDAIVFMKQRNIYEKILFLLTNTKKDQVVIQLLKFLSFLFENDNEDISHIIKPIYDKLGPSDILLEWINKNIDKASHFIEEMLTSENNLKSFENLSTNGFEALSEIIVTSNQKLKRLKVMMTYKYSINDNGNTVETQTTTESTQMIGPMLPKNKVKHLYILVSPFKLLGMKFLSNLLHIVKNSKVYEQAVKLIIKFIVRLDGSIADRTVAFRKQFLSEIIRQIEQIENENKFDEEIKQKVQVYINLFFQIFVETQKNGIGDISPHFQNIKGEKITLKVENNYPQLKKNKIPKFDLVMNQNDTVWKFKTTIAQIINENPLDIQVTKYVDPVDDTLNCKSLIDLSFYDGEGIKIGKKTPKQIPKHNLFNQKQTDLSERFSEIVGKWFDQYKNKDNVMAFEDLQVLAEANWKGSLLRQPDKLKKIMEGHDINKKGYLVLEEFRNFFYQKSKKNPNAIWKLIHQSGYKNNLKTKEDQIIQFSPDTLPRRILSNPDLYNLIFKFMRNPTFQHIQLSFYQLLSQLEVDPSTKKNIEDNIFEIIQQSKSIYQFCYAIEIIYSSITSFQEYFVDFWRKRGCEKILTRINQLVDSNESIYGMDSPAKNTLMPNLLKIINYYMKYLCCDKPLNRFFSSVKINIIDIDDLNKRFEEFKESDQEISQKLLTKHKLEQIQKQIDYQLYFKTSVKILKNLIVNFKSESNDFLPKLTAESVRLLALITFQKPALFNPLEFISGTKSDSLNYRRGTGNLIYLYIQHNQTDSEDFVMELLEQMPHEAKFIYGNYFSFLSKIVEFYLEKYMETEDKDQFFITLANRLLDKLFDNIEGEDRNAIIGDKIMVGILNTIRVLLKKDNLRQALKGRKHEITQKSLFAYNIQEKINQLKLSMEVLAENKQLQHFTNYVLCKTEQTREIAYQIVNRLHQTSAKEDPQFIQQYIMPLFDVFDEQVRMTDTKCMSVGLKNFGNTCYMNSMLQVLNSISPFRNLLLQAQSDSNLVKQLKNTFSELFFSQRLDYAPQKLLQAFVPPINPAIQQDTTQFLNFLFDQLQSGLENTPYKNLLNEIFKGTTIAQMICSQCKYKKQNREEFFSYGIEIDGRIQLGQALQHAHEGQVISDYRCDKCEQKGDMKKRNLLDQIPNILFINLRRIVFNYDMFVNMKIHSRLQFPNQLNIEPYTKQGVELRESLGIEYLKNLPNDQSEMKKFEEKTLHGKQKDYYRLKLKGVIVHSGSADVGHYYSIISNKNNTWSKFDDSRVSVFTTSGFQNQCYGGTWQNSEWGGFGSSTNAYFLVYQRVIKKQIKLGEKQKKQPHQIQEELAFDYDQIKTYNAQQQYKRVWLENHKFMVQRHLLQDHHSKLFINFICSLLKEDTNLNKIQLISHILYNLTIHSQEIGEINEIFKCHINDINPGIMHNYILKDRKKTFKLLFSHNLNVRGFMGFYLATVLTRVYQSSNSENDRKQVLDFISEYINNLSGEVAKNWLRISGYFLFINRIVIFAIEVPQFWQFMLKFNLISTLIDFAMEKMSPVKINPKNYSLGTKMNPVDFSMGLQTISLLLKHSYGFTGTNYELPKIPDHQLFHLTDNDVICLSYNQFYKKILRERQNTTAIIIIIQRLCIKNIQYSKFIIEILLGTIGSVTDMTDQMRDMGILVHEILKIQDQYWRYRAEMLLGVSNPYVINQNTMMTLDEERYVFSSTIYDIFPIESLFAYIYLYRLKNPLACFYLGKSIINGCLINYQTMMFLLRQPSPTYYFHSFFDWLQYFIKNLLNYITIGQKTRERVVKDLEEAFNSIQVYKKLMIEQGHTGDYKSIITGEIIESKQISKEQKNGIQVIIYEHQVYCLESQPAYSTNKSLDHYLKNARIPKAIDKSSNLLKFIKNQMKGACGKIQSDQDKQMLDLFDEDPDKLNGGVQTIQTPMEIEREGEKNSVDHKMQVIEEQRMENEEDERLQVVNIEGYFTNNYYREIKINCKQKNSKIVHLKFIDPQEPTNVILPLCYSFKVSLKSSESFWLSKQDHSKDWNPINFYIQVQDYTGNEKDKSRLNWFKLYGNPIVQNMEPSTTNQWIEQPLQAPKSEEQEESNQIACPSCTFLNLKVMEYCEICGEKLETFS